MQRPPRLRSYIPGAGIACLAVATGLARLGTVGAYIALAFCVVFGGYLIWAMATRWNRRD